VNAFKRLRIRIDDYITEAADNISKHDGHTATACRLHHRIPAGAWTALAGAAVTALVTNRRTAVGPLAILAAAASTAQTIISRAHEIAVAYPGHPCTRCPQPDDDDGHGGGCYWLDLDDDIPPAPGPMADYTDEQITAWAGDLDLQMLALHDAWKDGAFR
jgi:hypothetical protein